jgi:ubiquinone/menaquinone biosynthesis C-methylase UbiE
MSILGKFYKHLIGGTLLKTIKKRLSKKSTTEKAAPVGDTYYGARASEYLKTRHQQDYWHLEQKRIVEILDQLPKGSSVLDVPFGTGRFVRDYLKNDFKVTGLDASQDMIDVGRQDLGEDFNKVEVSVGNATKLPYPDLSFDYVVCVRFLTHIVNLEQAKQVISEFKRVTRKQLILQVRIRLDSCPKAKYPNNDEQIGDRFDQVQMTDFLNSLGLEVNKIDFLEKRETYHRAVIICTPIDMSNK